jgi:hypothetical protein
MVINHEIMEILTLEARTCRRTLRVGVDDQNPAAAVGEQTG